MRARDFPYCLFFCQLPDPDPDPSLWKVKNGKPIIFSWNPENTELLDGQFDLFKIIFKSVGGFYRLYLQFMQC